MNSAEQDHPLDPESREKSQHADESDNPLWAVAMGLACVFAVIAAVMAFG